MKRPICLLFAAAILFILSTVEFVLSREHPVKADPIASATSRDDLISAPGRVEAISEEIRVRKGQVLAQIENQDYIDRVAAAEATLAQRQAELQRTSTEHVLRK